jgi:uncharacterized protein (DUF924 family)
MAIATPDDVLALWFGPLDDPAYPQARASLWWSKDPAVDADIRARFEATWIAAGQGGLVTWSATPRGRLAHVLLLDQLARNMHRDTPQMYALDDEAQDLVLQGLLLGVHHALLGQERTFFYMPLMHAESVALQRLCVRLFAQMAEEARPADAEGARRTLDYAHQHAVIVERFGRFPHRNAILGRASTPEEQAFLEEPGSSF